MIEASLSPNTFPAQHEADLTLQVHNIGNGPCKRVNLRLQRPPGLLFVGRSPSIEVELLAPGQRESCYFTVRADAPGRFQIGTANYSYRDERGRPLHPEGPSWTLEVLPAVTAPSPEQPSPLALERTKVFISYRWSDSRDRAYLLYEKLARAFGSEHVHLDQEGASLGSDFQARMTDGLRASSAMLVLIGPAWNPEIEGTGKRRLDHENDPIRYEVEAGLRAGMHMIPVMSQEVPVPAVADLPERLRPLLLRNIAFISPTQVTASINRIIDDLRPHVAGGRFR